MWLHLVLIFVLFHQGHKITFLMVIFCELVYVQEATLQASFWRPAANSCQLSEIFFSSFFLFLISINSLLCCSEATWKFVFRGEKKQSVLVAISPTTTEFQSINPERKKGEKLPFKISFMQKKWKCIDCICAWDQFTGSTNTIHTNVYSCIMVIVTNKTKLFEVSKHIRKVSCTVWLC